MSTPFTSHVQAQAEPVNVPLPAEEQPAPAAELEVELLVCTHEAVVVRARVEFDDAGQAREMGMVMMRRHGQREQPTPQALLQAARDCLTLASSHADVPPGATRRVLVRVNGRWIALLDAASDALSGAMSDAVSDMARPGLRGHGVG